MNELISLLEAPKQIYISIHSYELSNEYVSFRTFSNDEWKSSKDSLMYENNEEQSDIIGKSCTLLNPYKGYTEGTVVGDYGDRIIVSLTSGKEISEYRDEVIIYE